MYSRVKMNSFQVLSVFSVLFFLMVIFKWTFVAQLLGPGLPEPFFGGSTRIGINPGRVNNDELTPF